MHFLLLSEFQICTGMYYHSKMTYKIIKEYRKVNHEGNKNGIIENGLIDKLLLAEIIEGITPIIYSTCIALAFYGPNASIISNVGNTYWSKKIENITPLFSTMFILFAVDTSSVVINFIALWKMEPETEFWKGKRQNKKKGSHFE